jgi:hypothetical protein
MNNTTQDIRLTLTVTETNQILEALGQRTYVDVYRLIGKIQQQADAQLNGGEPLIASAPHRSSEAIPEPDQQPPLRG